MGYAVTHIITTLVLVDVFRHHFKFFPRKYLLLTALFAILPDVDIFFGFVYQFLFGSWTTLKELVVVSHAFHGTFSHSLFIPVIVLGITLALYRFGKKNWMIISGLLAFSWFWHIILDLLIHGEAYPLIFWPFHTGIVFSGLLPLEGLAGLDALLLLLWLAHEELGHKIKAYF